MKESSRKARKIFDLLNYHRAVTEYNPGHRIPLCLGNLKGKKGSNAKNCEHSMKWMASAADLVIPQSKARQIFR